MNKSLTVLLVASLFLVGCGGWSTSRVNPSNWFGGGRSTAVETVESDVNPLLPPKRAGLLARDDAPDTSVLIAAVTELRVEQTPSGAIIYATGLASRQGAFDTVLRPSNEDLAADDGVLAFEFRVHYPEDPSPVGAERTRTIHEAFTVTKQDLAGVKVIRIVGQQNAQESRRR